MKTSFVQFVGYGVVGAVGTMAQYAVLIAGVSIFAATPVLASSVGGAIGAVTNYWLNHRFIFRSRTRHSQALLKFFAIALMGLMVNGAVIEIVVRSTDTHYLVAQAIATVIVLLFGFAANRSWTFKDKSNEHV